MPINERGESIRGGSARPALGGGGGGGTASNGGKGCTGPWIVAAIVIGIVLAILIF